MENEGKIKISLGITICIFIIFLLIIALMGMFIYYNNRDSKEFVADNSRDNDIKLMTTELVEKRNEAINSSNKEENTNKEFVKNISLNGISHEIAFIYGDTKVIDEIKYDKIDILFDSKIIKTFYQIARPGEEKEDPKVQMILGGDNKEYVIIELNTYENYGATNYFVFINELGQVLGILDNPTQTGISFNGEALVYKINKDNMKLYKTISSQNYNPNAVAIEYEIKVNSNMLDVSVTKVYSEKEVILSGAKI